jgi:hypothetical protein
LPPKFTRGYPSSRKRNGSANPASIRAASLVEPARPDNDNDALIVLTRPHSEVAWL